MGDRSVFESNHILLSSLHSEDLALGAPSTCPVGADTYSPHTPSLCGVVKESTVNVMVVMMMIPYQLQLSDCCVEMIAFGFRFDPLEEAPRSSCGQLNRNGINDKCCMFDHAAASPC
jgi:hypothetical protein